MATKQIFMRLDKVSKNQALKRSGVAEPLKYVMLQCKAQCGKPVLCEVLKFAIPACKCECDVTSKTS
eukprot:2625543-Amphidinium_carterae.1